MGMDHKAFLFDTKCFQAELMKVLLRAGLANDPEAVKRFIEQHATSIKSPYSGELIDEDWEEELENKDIQEYADFALTAYYDPEDNCGLSYAWDAVITGLKALHYKKAEYSILGKPISKKDFCVDPGYCGLGLVNAKDIPVMLRELSHLQQAFETLEPASLEIEDDIGEDEFQQAFEDLLALYRAAADDGKGILFTF